MRETVLVTGGTGYVGSHAVVQLLNAGAQVVIFDNLSNSSPLVIDRIEKITGRRPDFIEGNLCDPQALNNVFHKYPINKVVHFAGLKAVGESNGNPLKYYENNVCGSLNLFRTMSEAGVYTLVFSSSATVYGKTDSVQYHEGMPLAPVNVYGRTKLMIEDILRDLKQSQNLWRIALLRYFNPVGAHESGLLGESPSNVPNNLMPLIADVALHKRDKLYVFGNDYPTFDGTGLRDYIHVEDLVAGHIAALHFLDKKEELITVNLGTGRAYSVFEMISNFEKISNKNIPFEIVGRREGDLPEYYADPSLAKQLLGWESKHDVHRMCLDTWRWSSNNPQGFI